MNLTNNVGIDLVEIADIKKRLNDKFIQRILSINELDYYQKISHPKRKIEYLAGRFAAKEAYVKAYGIIDKPLNFVDVEIINDDLGKPLLSSKYRPNDKVSLSISHTEHYAIAIVIINSLEKGVLR